jgi:voltage-gated potassium channel
VSIRSEIHHAFSGSHPRLGGLVDHLVMGLIAVSLVSVGLETIDGLPAWLDAALPVAETVIVGVFTVEYLARVFAAPNRLKYIFSFYGLVDFFSIAPFYVALAFTGVGLDLRGVRALRLMRVFQLLKMTRYTRAMDRLIEAWRSVREEVVVFTLASAGVLYLCALIVYYCENEAQPEAFASVLDAMWWAAVTLTSVGYGDIYPITPLGRLFTVLMLFVGLGVVAVPAGLVAAALTTIRRREDEAARGEPPPE